MRETSIKRNVALAVAVLFGLVAIGNLFAGEIGPAIFGFGVAAVLWFTLIARRPSSPGHHQS